MKRLALFLILLCYAAVSQAQHDHCDKFNNLLDKAKILWAQKKFEDAFAKLSAARETCPGKAAEVDNQYAIFIRDIANKYETADVKTREAKREAERAVYATRVADQNAEQSDSIAKAAKRAARRAYANDLAYKSTISLRDGDRTAAFRLAEFAHRYVDDDNLNVTNALVQAIYYNEDPNHSFLPWSSNLQGHTSRVLSVAFSPDSKQLATGSDDKSAKIWDLTSGKDILTLEGHNSSIWSIAFSPDGKLLATGSNNAKIWDAYSGKQIFTLNGHTCSVSSVAFSPNGKYLATGSLDNSVKVWDISNGKEIMALNGHSSYVSSVAFSPDSRYLATGSADNSAKIWDLVSKKEITNFIGHTSSVLSVAFSPDGKYLATGSADNSAKIWDLASKKEMIILNGHTSSIWSVAFSPNSKQLVTGSYDKSAKIWDISSGNEIVTLKGHTSYIRSVAFSPDGKQLATGSLDKSVKIWNLSDASDIIVLKGHKSYVGSVAFSLDGKWLATGSGDNSAKIWDLESGKNIMTLNGHTSAVLSVDFSPDSKYLATGSKDRNTKIWDLKTGEDIITLVGHSGSVTSVAFSSNGKYLATGSEDKSAKIWDIVNRKEIITLNGHTSYIKSVAFSPDSKYLATGSLDKSAKIWEIESRKIILSLKHPYSVLSVDFSPNGKWLATSSDDNNAKIWDLESGKDIMTLNGHNSSVLCVDFSPDGKKLVTGSDDNSAKIWDLESGKDILTFNGHNSSILSVKFSPNGKIILTGSNDLNVKIWELTPEGWISNKGKNRKLAGLLFSELNAFNLSELLNLQPENELILCELKDANQITAFADLYSQNARNSHDLSRTMNDFARAARLYNYANNIDNDSSLTSRLGNLYQHWAEDILESNRPDTAIYYINLSCQFCNDKTQCLKLWHTYSQKNTKPLNIIQFLSSEKPDELQAYGDYFFNTEKWIEAQQFYEKVETIQHSAKVLEKLFDISDKNGKIFNFDWFLDSQQPDELRAYGDYFFRNNKWKEATQVYEKAETIQHSAKVLEKLFDISDKNGKMFNFNRFLISEDATELDEYANFFIEKCKSFEKFKDKVLDFQKAVLIREKLLTVNSTTLLRTTISNDYNRLGYYQLFLPDGESAEISFQRSLILNPNNLYAKANLTHALYLQGRMDEAKLEYNRLKNLKMDGNYPTFRDGFLQSLKEMEEQGVPNFDYSKIRAWLEEKN